MQINIDKKMGIFTGIIIVLLAIIMSMSSSRNDERGFFGMHGFGMMGSDYNQRSSDLSGADIMFLQMMIPHHQQAVDISNLALAKSKDAELLFDLLWLEGMTNHHDGALHMVGMIDDAKNAEIKRFGKDIATAQTAQIEQMKLMIARLS